MTVGISRRQSWAWRLRVECQAVSQGGAGRSEAFVQAREALLTDRFPPLVPQLVVAIIFSRNVEVQRFLTLEISMKSARILVYFVVVVVALAGWSDAEAGGLTIYVPNLVPALRGSGFQSYPLAIDSSGDVYTVTGTSPSDSLLEITASGQVLTINSAVGGVIGTHGKLDFGFGGNLFATSNGGIIEFSLPSGSGSFFYTALRLATRDSHTMRRVRFFGLLTLAPAAETSLDSTQAGRSLRRFRRPLADTDSLSTSRAA